MLPILEVTIYRIPVYRGYYPYVLVYGYTVYTGN
jgi:hypothetical protein